MSESKRTREEIGQVLSQAHSNLEAFRKAIERKHVVIFLGNTKSGKSTLVNFVMGTNLVAYEERHPIFKIRKDDKNASGPEIGQGVLSCTSFPGVYPLNDLGMVIIDAPGFDDNRSEAQDIINALYICQIENAKTVKFVLVSDLNELSADNIKGFTDLMENIHTLLCNINQLKDSVSIVFTKDYREHTQEDMVLMLQQKILTIEGLHLKRELVEHFVGHPEVIGIFRMPASAGVVTSSVDVNIENSRVSCLATLLEEGSIKAALSAKSRLALKSVYQQHLDSAFFEEALNTTIDEFCSYFDVHDYVFASTSNELANVKSNLECNLRQLDRECRQNEGTCTMGQIKESLRRIAARHIPRNFAKDFDLLVMIDEASLMEDTIRANFIAKFKKSVKDLTNKVRKLVDKIKDQLKDRENARTMFKASAGVAGTAGGVGVFGEVLHRVLADGSRLGSPLGILGMIGGAVAAIGAGVAATSYATEKVNEEKRIKARNQQGRVVFDGMFDDE